MHRVPTPVVMTAVVDASSVQAPIAEHLF